MGDKRMFLQGRIARILGTIMAAFSCVPWARHAAAKSYVLAENPCVLYNDDYSPDDCKIYMVEGCAEGCVPAPYGEDGNNPYFITGSTDPRDLQVMCIETKDNGNGGYIGTGFIFTGSDEFGSYTIDVSGCFLESPISTGRYGSDYCETTGSTCDPNSWDCFNQCLNERGCMLNSWYTGMDSCHQDYSTENDLITGIICFERYNPTCSIWEVQDGRCDLSASGSAYRDYYEMSEKIQFECGDIMTPAGTYIENVGRFTGAGNCGSTGYLL